MRIILDTTIKYDPQLYIKYMYAFSYYFFETGNINLRKEIGHTALKICENYGWMRDYYWTQINEIAYLEYIQGHYDKCETIYLDCYSSVLKMYHADIEPKNRFSSTFIFGLLNRYLGLVYTQKRVYDKAIKYFGEAQKIFDSLGRKSIMCNVNVEIGELYIKLGHFAKGKTYLLQCESYYFNNMKPWMKSWLARVYLNLSIVFEHFKNQKDSEYYFCKAEKLATERGSNLLLFDIFFLKAEHAFLSKDYIYGRNCIEIAKKIAKKMRLYNKLTLCTKLVHLYKAGGYEMDNTNHKNLVMVLSKAPYSKESKTRLAKDVGDLSTKIAESMLYDLVNELTIESDYNLCLCIPNKDAIYLDNIKKLLGAIDIKVRNSSSLRGQDSDLYAVFSEFLEIYKKVIMVYSDTPFITKDIIQRTFDLLDQNDVVIGTDGAKGYYLVGMKTAIDIFTSLPNMTVPYLNQSVKIIEDAHLSFSFVPSLKDIDCLSDILQIDWNSTHSWKMTKQTLLDSGIIDLN